MFLKDRLTKTPRVTRQATTFFFFFQKINENVQPAVNLTWFLFAFLQLSYSSSSVDDIELGKLSVSWTYGNQPVTC